MAKKKPAIRPKLVLLCSLRFWSNARTMPMLRKSVRSVARRQGILPSELDAAERALEKRGLLISRHGLIALTERGLNATAMSCRTVRLPPFDHRRTFRGDDEALGSAYRERIPGGKAAGRRPSDFNQRQLKRGLAVEREHTRSDKVAREIAMDHLIEDPNYYTKLATIHIDGARRQRKRG